MGKFLVALVSGGILTLIFTQFFTIFVIQPIGALPDGRTILLYRSGQLQFIDSPDSICERIQGGVNLICRAGALGIVKPENIVARFPYSRTLYLISTGGKEYDRQMG